MQENPEKFKLGEKLDDKSKREISFGLAAMKGD